MSKPKTREQSLITSQKLFNQFIPAVIRHSEFKREFSRSAHFISSFPFAQIFQGLNISEDRFYAPDSPERALVIAFSNGEKLLYDDQFKGLIYFEGLLRREDKLEDQVIREASSSVCAEVLEELGIIALLNKAYQDEYRFEYGGLDPIYAVEEISNLVKLCLSVGACFPSEDRGRYAVSVDNLIGQAVEQAWRKTKSDA